MKIWFNMRDSQRIRSPVWVCSFHEVGVSRKNWIVQGQRKSVEKRPYVARFCELHKVLFFI